MQVRTLLKQTTKSKIMKKKKQPPVQVFLEQRLTFLLAADLETEASPPRA